MKKRILLPLIMCFTAGAHASGSVKVDWQNPDDYTDIRPVNQTRSSFQRQVFKELEAELTELAESLPDGQVLSLTVTDLDLAGQVWPGNFIGFGQSAASDVRLIKSLYIPRMAFSYTLTDTTGATLQSADVRLKDMMFMDRANHAFRSDSLRYEKNMLRNWFADELAGSIARSE